MAELQTINESGELTEIRLNGTGDEKKVFTFEDLGDFSFAVNEFRLDDKTVITGGGGAVIFTEEQQRSGMYVVTDNYVDIIANNNVDPAKTIRVDTGAGVRLPNTEIADITEAKQIVTKEWVDNKVTGASGSFLSGGGETITVVNGLITDIQEPI